MLDASSTCVLTIFDERYNLSKLLLLYAIIELASIIDPATKTTAPDSNAIVVNSLDPCFCKTELAAGIPLLIKPLFKLFEFICARPAEEGSRLVVVAASAGRETHGGYMRGGALQEYAPFITSKDGVEKSHYVWKVLSQKLDELQPGILANLNTV